MLDEALPALLGRGLVVDLRSSRLRRDVAPARRARRPHRRACGCCRRCRPAARGVVSYPSKFAKGRLAAALVRRLAAGEPVRTAEDVAATWLADGGADAEVGRRPNLVVIHTGLTPA